MHTRAHVFWSALEAAASAILAFVSAFVVARIVGPAELGIGAAAIAPNVLLWVALNVLFGDAVVQRAGLEARDASSAFWASGAFGVAGAAIQIAIGWPVASFLGDDRLIWMSAALAVPLPLVGAAGVVQGVLNRERRYKALAGRVVLGQGAGTLLGIAGGFAGWGAWALVLQQAAISVLGALVLLFRASWRPQFEFCFIPVREMLRVGAPLTASTLVQIGRYRLFALVIGSMAGPAALGQMHLAFRLTETVRDLVSTALWRLLLPQFSEQQHDPPALRNAIRHFLSRSGPALFALAGAIVLASEPMIALLLNPAWAPAGAAAAPLALLMGWTFLQFPAGVAAITCGGASCFLHANLASTAIVVLGAVLLRPVDPLQAAWIWLGGHMVTSPYTWRAGAHRLHTSPIDLVRPGLPWFLLAACATALAAGLPLLWPAAHGACFTLVLRFTIFIIAYATGSLGLCYALPSPHVRTRARNSGPSVAGSAML
ncbi:MAG: oligosaccharide flippase family protein [Acetobacteraceae bacterium]|nr:oligosaccharide flippase family protein [Acetobacteraceae bacterium]